MYREFQDCMSMNDIRPNIATADHSKIAGQTEIKNRQLTVMFAAHEW